ncbi:MAG: LamG-like jellyroll fold domain-containing protein [Planctomycetota bacterium]
MATYRITATILILVATAAAEDDELLMGQHRIEGPPESLGVEKLSDEAVRTAEEIAHWATLPADGAEGRPLPLTGSWNVGRLAFKERRQGREHPMREWGPAYFVELIKRGHHVLPTFIDPQFLGKHYIGAEDAPRRGEQIEAMMSEYFGEPLAFCRKFKLPIAFRDWNWISRIKRYEEWRRQYAGAEFSVEETGRLIKNGAPGRLVSPIGPVERWTEWGRFWFGNPIMKRLQEMYPDPPMAVFLDNNEIKVHWASQITDEHDRFVERFGKGLSEMEKAVIIREGYDDRMAAMFAAARDALIEPAWKTNTVTVGYNNLWGTGHIGRGSRPDEGIGFDPDPEKGWLEWRRYDGGMPEYYDNDWQPGKTDHTPWSPQTEAMNYYSVQDWLFAQDPDFYWSSIAWDGGAPSDVWRGKRRKVGKPYRYVTRGQRYDFHRYGGMVQFGLWAMRPRSFREFRGGGNRGAYRNGTWMALVRAVDRPWDHAVLREFWRFGELVPNPDEEHPFALEQDDPQWVRDLDRWYMLTCDANPPRDEWTGHTKLRVFSLALVRGDKPRRRWLIHAHAPLGAVADATVNLPGYGAVTLPSVPVGGVFYLVREDGRSVETVLNCGPAEIAVRAGRQYVKPGQDVTFEATVTSPPDQPIRAFTWSFATGEDVVTDELKPVSRTFDAPGEHLVTVTARVGDGELVGQTVVFVGEPPAKAEIYRLPLDNAFAWRGPWSATGPEGRKLVTYRHVPNAGSLAEPVLVGGAFVADEQRGRVLEIREDRDALWLALGTETVLHEQGHADKTISLWFKPDDVEARQVLYAEGHGGFGFNIYLDDGKVYGGAWAPSGRKWDGHWLSDEVEPGRWHHVSLVLAGATEEVAEDKLYLYLDGERAGSGPGVRVPRHFAVPRVAQSRMKGRLMTRFHDGGEEAAEFRGRIDDFRLVNAARPPE